MDNKPTKKTRSLRAETKEFTPKELKQLETAAGLGLNEREICKMFFISRATLHRRMAEFPEVNEAIHRGRITSKMAVRASAYKMATDGKHPAMTMFWLKFFDRHVEDPDVEEGGVSTDTLIGSALIAQEIAAAVANMTPEQIAKELKTLTLEAKHGVYSLPESED